MANWHSRQLRAFLATLFLTTAIPVRADNLVGTGEGDTLVGKPTPSTISGKGGDDQLWGDPAVSIGLITKIRQISTSDNGTGGNQDAGFPAISADGNLVVFSSLASNLVSGDGNGNSDVFLADLSSHKIKLISTDATSIQGASFNGQPDISADGKLVVFTSQSITFDATKPAGTTDIFLKHLDTGAIEPVSLKSTGGYGNGSSSLPILSPDGTKVLFTSLASDLVADDTNGIADLFIRDLVKGTTTRVSTDSDGHQLTDLVSDPVFSPDGTAIAFASASSDLVSGDHNSASDIFVKKLSTGLVTRVSLSTGGAEGNKKSGHPAFSPDGKWVAFDSDATNLVPGDKNNKRDVFARNLKTGKIRLVSSTVDEKPGNETSGHPVFIAEGTKIAFDSDATNLDLLDGNNSTDIYIKDLISGKLSRASTDIEGYDGDDDSTFGGSDSNRAISRDGTIVVFTSIATNLVLSDTNGLADIFAAELTAPVGADDKIRGNSGDDVLMGNVGDDLLLGGPGADVIDGGPGNDTSSYAGSSSGVNIDLLRKTGKNGDAEGDVIEGVENLIGSDFTDVLTGGNGRNIIIGGKGLDTLTGNGGADRFVYTSRDDSPAETPDVILDFSASQKDVVDLSGVDANRQTPATNDVFVFIEADKFTRKPRQLRFANSRLEGDTDGNGKADFVIRLKGVTDLPLSRFIP